MRYDTNESITSKPSSKTSFGHKTMTLDSRSKRRKETSFLVELRYTGGGPIPCHAHNLSVDGMLIESDKMNQIKGFRVDLTIHLDNRHYEIQAIIKRRHNNQIGLKFCKPQPELYRIVTRHKRYAHTTISSRVM
jgi:hypothetical protein